MGISKRRTQRLLHEEQLRSHFTSEELLENASFEPNYGNKKRSSSFSILLADPCLYDSYMNYDDDDDNNQLQLLPKRNRNNKNRKKRALKILTKDKAPQQVSLVSSISFLISYITQWKEVPCDVEFESNSASVLSNVISKDLITIENNSRFGAAVTMTLPPILNPYNRFIIHTIARDFFDLKSKTLDFKIQIYLPNDDEDDFELI